MAPEALFLQAAQANALAHAYIFSGNDTLRKQEILQTFVKTAGVSIADQSIVQGEKEITIADIRGLSAFFNFSSWTSPYKVGIIHDAHTMNTEAQSAFLKLLEEPKGKALLFLVTQYPNALLDTIRSRCQELRFYGFPVPQAGVKARNDFERLRQASLHDRFVFAKELAETPELIAGTLAGWLAVLRNAMREAAKSDAKTAYAFAQKIKTAQEIAHILQTTNASPRLALERLLLALY